MKMYIYNILLWIDEGLNVFLAPLIRAVFRLPQVGAEGSAHYTCSQTFAELRQNGNKVGCVACYLLTKIWKLWIKTPNYEHCDAAMQGVPQSESVG